jgi:hypothetical protein
MIGIGAVGTIGVGIVPPQEADLLRISGRLIKAVASGPGNFAVHGRDGHAKLRQPERVLNHRRGWIWQGV